LELVIGNLEPTKERGVQVGNLKINLNFKIKNDWK
jgi:hypothetical protein